MKRNFRAFGAFCGLMKFSSSRTAACSRPRGPDAGCGSGTGREGAESLRHRLGHAAARVLRLRHSRGSGPGQVADPHRPEPSVGPEPARPGRDQAPGRFHRGRRAPLYAFQDGTVSTFVKKGAAREGLILRYQDEKNFLVLLVDAVTGEAVLSSYVGGKAAELGRGTRPGSFLGGVLGRPLRDPSSRSSSTIRNSSAPGTPSRRPGAPGSRRQARGKRRSTSSCSSSSPATRRSSSTRPLEGAIEAANRKRPPLVPRPSG